ncbi:glutamate ABC transporter substrate-binding protein [Dactylosporangium darangshiense]|uniref:Glutamate ABC transporter substrate-binding protein n=1 Tax=Dactylosporangium darangshiense TaxID=579108 RepID=A0ABP8DU35_9ACTN
MRHNIRAAALFAVVAFILAASATGCGKSDTGTAARPSETFAAGTTMDKIQQRGKLIVGVKFDQPLFGLKNPVSGKIEGFDIEIAKMIAKDITGSDQNIEYIETVTANREAFIQQGKVDIVVATYAVSEERRKQVGFAGPYYDTGVSIMVRKGEAAIKGAADLADRQVCTVTGAKSADLLPTIQPKAQIVKFGTYSNCAQALKEKRVDAVVTGEAILLGIVAQNPDAFQMVDGYLAGEENAIGFPKDDSALHDYLNDFLSKIFASGEWLKAYQATVGTATHRTPAPPKIAL